MKKCARWRAFLDGSKTIAAMSFRLSISKTYTSWCVHLSWSIKLNLMHHWAVGFNHSFIPVCLFQNGEVVARYTSTKSAGAKKRKCVLTDNETGCKQANRWSKPLHSELKTGGSTPRTLAIIFHCTLELCTQQWHEWLINVEPRGSWISLLVMGIRNYYYRSILKAA